VYQFSLVGLPEGLRIELLYGLQQRDQAPPPLDPTEVRILLTRLGEAGSLRDADPQAVCESGGTVYNTATRGLFRDLRRHLDRAWAQYTSTDPFVGDVWQVALLDLRANTSRRWPASQGVVDFRVIEQPWLREVAAERGLPLVCVQPLYVRLDPRDPADLVWLPTTRREAAARTRTTSPNTPPSNSEGQRTRLDR
jgi:hypothetical protein